MIAASLTNRLADPSLVREQALVAGEWVDAAARIEVRNPSTGELLAEVADMALSDIRRAIVAADVAQRLWAEATGKERAPFFGAGMIWSSPIPTIWPQS